MTEKTILWNSSRVPVPYPDAIAGMERQVAGIRDGSLPERVWLLEHPPTYTAGTSARQEDLFNPSGFPTYAAGRGGQWTYHGPGQRVAYVMLDLTSQQGTVPPRDLRAYVHALEEWLIRTLRRFDVRGERRTDRIGVWVVDPVTGRESKIAALGVRVTRWTCWHGVALNVAPNLAHFEGIVPCGIREHGVTSLHELGRDVDMATVDEALRANWQDLFGSTPTPIGDA